jgi:hypothetical protein
MRQKLVPHGKYKVEIAARERPWILLVSKVGMQVVKGAYFNRIFTPTAQSFSF